MEILRKTEGKKGNVKNGIMVILWKGQGQNGHFTMPQKSLAKGHVAKIKEKEFKSSFGKMKKSREKKRKTLERGMCPSHDS